MKRQRLLLLLLPALVLTPACRRPAEDAKAWLDRPLSVFPDPVSYELKVDADTEAGTLAGECALRLKNAAKDPIAVVPLNLYRLMEVSSVTDAAGRALPFTQNVRVFEDWKELQVDHLRVGLGSPLAPGGETTLRIRYGGPLLGYAEAMRYVKDRVGKDLTVIRADSFAYPQIGLPSWRTNRAAGLKDFAFEVSLTVPSSLVVANGGTLVSKTEKDGRTTYVYRSRVPSWRIDLIASDFRTFESEDGRFRIFASPGDAEGAHRLLESLTGALALYTRWFGPLESFPGLTVIEVPDGYGSQADAVAIIQEAKAFRDPAGRATFYHELSHLWNVAEKDPLPSRFESEGLAMFLQGLVQEELENKTGAVDDSVRALLPRLAKLFREHPDWTKTAMIDYGEKDLTDLSYSLGQVFFYLLYRSLGEEAFLGTIAGYIRDYRGTGATARQFVDYVKNASAVDLDKLFEDWVFTPQGAQIVLSGATVEEIRRLYR